MKLKKNLNILNKSNLNLQILKTYLINNYFLNINYLIYKIDL